MSKPSFGWVEAVSDSGDKELHAGDITIKSKYQPADAKNLIWLHVRLPSGTWAYHVLRKDTGEHIAAAMDRTKRGAYEKARALL